MIVMRGSNLEQKLALKFAPKTAHVESARRKRPEHILLAGTMVQPLHSVRTAQDRHLAIMIGRDIRIRLGGQDRIGFQTRAPQVQVRAEVT